MTGGTSPTTINTYQRKSSVHYRLLVVLMTCDNSISKDGRTHRAIESRQTEKNPAVSATQFVN